MGRRRRRDEKEGGGGEGREGGGGGRGLFVRYSMGHFRGWVEATKLFVREREFIRRHERPSLLLGMWNDRICSP